MKTTQMSHKAINWLLLSIYAFFCYLMLQITLQYIPLHTDVAFLKIKQDHIHLQRYQWAFFTHVYTSMFALLAGFTQFSQKLRFTNPKLHQYIGWLYIITILLCSAPSGLVLGIYANGGYTSQIAFSLLAVVWFYFTLKAMTTAKQKKYQLHQQFMWRSFALTLSAITLRLWKYLLVWAFEPRPMDVYRWVAWLGWGLNLLIVELYIIYQHKK